MHLHTVRRGAPHLHLHSLLRCRPRWHRRVWQQALLLQVQSLLRHLPRMEMRYMMRYLWSLNMQSWRRKLPLMQLHSTLRNLGQVPRLHRPHPMLRHMPRLQQHSHRRDLLLLWQMHSLR